MHGALTHTRNHLVPFTSGATSPGCHSGVPLASIVLGALLMERCVTDILVVGDVLKHCLVVGCVLGVVRLEVCLIACLLPWSSGKSERCICSTLRKLITSIN
jgi:hypothetical protein